MSTTVTSTNFTEFPLISKGKVRDIYDLGENLLIVVTDRLSAFDHILPQPIPDKGRVLNLMSKFWFEMTADKLKNHMISTEVADLPQSLHKYGDILQGRFTLAHKAKMVPVECIVRGYLSGSGWNDYKRTGAVCGIKLPEGLQDSSKLPSPLFTPSTKAESGHDENISFDQAVEIVGAEVAARIRDASLMLYTTAADYALTRGIIIADTKFEFGFIDGELIVCDEVLTPDSSRFWPADQYAPGRAQPSFDKQYVRDYLLQIGWNKEPPIPSLPPEVVANTSSRYVDAYMLLTGRSL
ncbi:MAG TPA: phosphoribosylaminoimidazolesuccinocarboxamide synthase [Myxococcota bacterium]|nr:phosphoribosylaminoimidazolesuccinocarboxamide synthase [Myxococcota bacterium]HOA13600.1 phosphoribosylaminoimidazolesuccinocarboxamide synthase [Myxococcota bacterium]HOC99318.1 phosphoribosylaminoimidazolesuccinocarboxamide synthase [Myxococcota bacterium]HOH77846.1 phosphoribosylaminoimidazolesuccinocarboxamide synthase [Myxococcota bacterium]HPV04752.1 phosphoribosylaminoimidazolesuccinocarboxamide synthase [Myxococcota bacterium]